MTHPKSSTSQSLTQVPLLTRASEFHDVTRGGRTFFTVSAGLPVEDALNEAGTILGAAESVAKLQDGGLDANQTYCVRLMISAAQALINASIVSVEISNSHGGAE